MEDLNSPLLGIDLNNHTAQALGNALDKLSSSKAAKLVNFAHVQTSWQLLGQGSFSKVYRYYSLIIHPLYNILKFMY